MDGGSCGGTGKYEQEMRDALADLKEHDDRFQVKFEELEQKRKQLEQRREESRDRWQQEIVELSRLQRDLDVEEAALRTKWQALFTRPLPVHSEHKDHKNHNNAWELNLMAWMISVVCGLVSIQMCDWFPLIHIKDIFVAFAVLWAPCSIVLSFRIFKRFRWDSTLSQHTERRSSDEKFLCFAILLGTCALYLLLRHLGDNFSGASPSSASEP